MWTVQKNASYNATLNPAIVKNYQEIQTALSQKSTQILDARPAGRFSGKEPEPRTGISSGHMPLSISLPFPDLVDPTTKTLLPKDKLFALFQSKKVDLSQPIICSCGSGITAAVIYVALEQVGAASVSVYDGSWAEYASLPTSVIVKD